MLLMKKVYFDAIRSGAKTITLRYRQARRAWPGSMHRILAPVSFTPMTSAVSNQANSPAPTPVPMDSAALQTSKMPCGVCTHRRPGKAERSIRFTSCSFQNIPRHDGQDDVIPMHADLAVGFPGSCASAESSRSER